VIMMTVVIVGTAVLPALAAASSGGSHVESIIVGRTDRGTVYWHGHRLEPPFLITIRFFAAPDTVWDGVYINEYPKELRHPAAPVDSEAAAYGEKHEALASEAWAKGVAAGASRATQLVAMADYYNSRDDMVDTAWVLGDGLKIKYRYRLSTVGLSVGYLNAYRSPKSAELHATAMSIFNRLNRGSLLVISGATISVPSGRVDSALQEIEAIQLGRTPESHLISDAGARAELANPRPIEVLLQEHAHARVP